MWILMRRDCQCELRGRRSSDARQHTSQALRSVLALGGVAPAQRVWSRAFTVLAAVRGSAGILLCATLRPCLRSGVLQALSRILLNPAASTSHLTVIRFSGEPTKALCPSENPTEAVLHLPHKRPEVVRHPGGSPVLGGELGGSVLGRPPNGARVDGAVGRIAPGREELGWPRRAPPRHVFRGIPSSSLERSALGGVSQDDPRARVDLARGFPAASCGPSVQLCHGGRSPR